MNTETRNEILGYQKRIGALEALLRRCRPYVEARNDEAADIAAMEAFCVSEDLIDEIDALLSDADE